MQGSANMSLDLTYDPNNIFARILRDEIPCHQIFDDAMARGFMDAFPQSRGHCLIVPKEPATNLLNLSPISLEAVITRTQKVARAVHTVLHPDGITIAQFNGAPAGQTVYHIHFHVIPRYEGTELGAHAAGSKGDPTDLASLAEAIAKAYQAL
jgi:histidine triad (HIT) family protein